MLRFDMNFLYTMINLIVLAFLLKKFLIKPVTDIMEKRRQLIKDGLKNAQNAQEDAMKMKEEYAQALGGAKEESVRIVEKARKDAKSEYCKGGRCQGRQYHRVCQGGYPCRTRADNECTPV